MLKRIGAQLGILASALLLFYLGYALKPTTLTANVAFAAEQATVLYENSALPPVIAYQARLLDAVTGQTKPDGAYTIAFNLYNVASAGSPLWSEVKNIPVNKGLLSTLLGDTTPLNLSLFNGQELYLGITVGSDPETAPRQRLAHVAYAIRAEQAAVATMADNAANADKVDGQDAAAFAAASHTHTGGDIADESITAADIQNRTRAIGIPANALSYDPNGTVITSIATGLQWQSNFQNSAFLLVPKPTDWDGTSNVVLRITFRVTTNNGGGAGFFIRPRSYMAGNVFADAASQTADGSTMVTVSANGVGTIYTQSFTILANKLTRDHWVITIQRLGGGPPAETYTDDVVFHTAELIYTATQ